MGKATQLSTDFAKAVLRFSWSLPLFGAQQLVNLLHPSRAIRAFNSASQSMEHELGRALHAAWSIGETIQRDVLDALGSARQVVTPSTPEEPIGWGPMPKPEMDAAEHAVAAHQSRISADYPFSGRFLEVFGSRMHYLDEGAGSPILLLHGNPTWSYTWRNIIPYLSTHGRCIVPDLIGYGRSDKPPIDYRWADQVRYLEEFIRQLNLRNVLLVLHDQGSALGFHYARRHENNVRGLAFFEALIRPYEWDSFSTPEFRDLFRKFRSGGIGGEGWQMLVDANVFIEQVLPRAAARPLSVAEMDYYREPFLDPKSRLPIWRLAQETPIGGEPPDVWEAVSAYSRWLERSPLPKILFYAEPGGLVTAEHLDWARRNIANLQTVYLGQGSHFLQESSPHEIGREMAHWIAELSRDGEFPP